MSDDSRLFDLFTDRFDKLETKVDNLAAVNVRLDGLEEDIRELKGRGIHVANWLMTAACVISCVVSVATHWR